MLSSNKLRRGFLGLVFVGALGIINSQWSDGPWYPTCPAEGYDYPYYLCSYGCGVGGGYCTAQGYCRCGQIP